MSRPSPACALRRSPLSRPRRCAFTLVEATISMVLLGVVVVAALATLAAATVGQQVEVSKLHGHALAQDLMSEILELPYEDPETPGGAKGRDGGDIPLKRESWDDVDDYDKWTQSPPLDRGGKTMSGFDGWSRSVAVEYVDPADPGTLSGSDRGLKRITVTIADPAGKPTVLVAMRSRAGVPDWPPEVDTTYASGLSIDIEIDQAGPSRIVSGAPLLNQPSTSGINLLFNGDVENGTDGWEGYTGCRVVEYAGEPRSGRGALLVTDRTTVWAGGGQEIRDVVESGATYAVQAWVAHSSVAPQTFHYRLTFDVAGEGTSYDLHGTRLVDTGVWRRLSATFVPDWGGTLVSLRLEIEMIDSTQPFVIDDAVLTESP